MKLLELLDEPIKNKNDFLFEDNFLYEEVEDVVDEVSLGRGGRASVSPVGTRGEYRLVILPDDNDFRNAQAFDFADERAATQARNYYISNDTPNFERATRRATRVNLTRLTMIDDFMERARALPIDDSPAPRSQRSLFNRFIRGSAGAAGGLFRYFLPIFMTAGQIYVDWLTTLKTIDLVNEDSNLSTDDKQELNSILRGMFYTQSGILALWAVSSTLRLTRIVRAVRAGVAAGGFAAAIPSGGTSLLAMIAGQVAITIVLAFLERPSVRKAFAEWIAGTMFGAMFEGMDFLANSAAATLDYLTGGLIGSQNLNRALGFEPGTPDSGLQGEVVASSEWAKLVFQDIIFPPDMERMKVPYFPQAQREQMLRQAFVRDGTALTSDTETDTPQPEEEPTALPPRPDDTQPAPEEEPTALPPRPA